MLRGVALLRRATIARSGISTHAVPTRVVNTATTSSSRRPCPVAAAPAAVQLQRRAPHIQQQQQQQQQRCCHSSALPPAAAAGGAVGLHQPRRPHRHQWLPHTAERSSHERGVAAMAASAPASATAADEISYL
eukprot:365779-Chlamydomonas_euryale.AAC.1